MLTIADRSGGENAAEYWDHRISSFQCMLFIQCDDKSTFSALSGPRWPSRRHYHLRPRQNGRHVADDTFKRIFLNETFRISIKISLKGSINNIPALFQIMAWRRSGDKPLSEPMMVRLLTHICVTRVKRKCQHLDSTFSHYLHRKLSFSRYWDTLQVWWCCSNVLK